VDRLRRPASSRDGYAYPRSVNPLGGHFPVPPGPNRPVDEERTAATLRGGIPLHKGFYDLLALISTPPPSLSRVLCQWGAGVDPPLDVVAGPRYKDLAESNNAPFVNFAVSLPSPGPVSSKKARRICKDMDSKPTGLMYVHDHCISPPLSLNSNQPFSACI
jgi:hypothetical protein